MNFMACLFVPDFAVEAIVRAEPELRCQAVAVMEGKAPLQKVFALNQKARRAGVQTGMTKLQLEQCEGLELRPRSALLETAAHAALLDAAHSFSPRVEDVGCDTVVLDLSGLEQLFGPVASIASELSKRVRELGLTANVATAANVDCAVIAARGFPGVTVIPQGKEADGLGSLPVEVLQQGEFHETWQRWGIRNLRALAALPEVALSERLGQRGLHLQQLARGATCRTLVPLDEPLLFEEAIDLDHPLLLLEPLAFLLSRMVEQLCARLEARAFSTQELRLRLELATGHMPEEATEHASHGNGSWKPPDAAELGFQSANGSMAYLKQPSPEVPARRIFQRTLRLPVPLLDAKVFLKLLQLDLRAHPPGAPIMKVHLSAEPVRPRAAQGGLFLPPSPEPEKLELTLARIAGIVGAGKVGSVALLDTHRPEAFSMTHFSPHRPEEKNGKRNLKAPEEKPVSSDDLVTALRMFRPAARVSVTVKEGKPTHIAGKQKDLQGEVLWQAGPWRCSGDWWERDGWARDEWDIAVQHPQAITLYRLVRDLLSGGWFLEGVYD